MSRTDPGLPAVTVLMPVYNGARFLREQVDSILAQQGVALRLVILDDGSTDDSFALATDLAEQDERITLAERRPNAGLTAAVARLLSFVETPYFAMSDQDDIWDSDKLAQSIARLEATGAALVYSDVRLCDEEGVVTEPSYLGSRRLQPVEGTTRSPASSAIPWWATRSSPDARSPRRRGAFLEAAVLRALAGRGSMPQRRDRHGPCPARLLPGPRLERRWPTPFGAHSGLGFGRNGRAPSRRQANRSSALRAAAHLCPDLRPLAAAYDATGPRRIIASVRLAGTLRRRCPEIKIAHVLREVALLLAWRAPRSRWLPTRGETWQQ